MRIVEVIPQLSSGGAERFVVDLCNQLEEYGHEVIVISLSRLDSSDGTNFYLSDLSKSIKIIEMNKKRGVDVCLFKSLFNVIRDLKPDVVHSHLRALPYLLPAFFLTKGIKYVHTVHNDAKVEASDAFNRISRKIAFKSKRCLPVTISKESDSSFQKYYGNNIQRELIINGSPKKDSHSGNAVEVMAAKEKGKITLVSVARHDEQKNLLSLIKALNEIPEIELFLIGNNNTEYGKLMKEMARSNIHILGERRNPRDYMGAADGFVLPSIYEGMPITLIECFSVGGFPIVTPVGGMKNMVVNNQNGLIIPSPSVKDIKACIEGFIQLPKERINQIRRASLESFDMYNINTCAKRYLKIFQH